MCHLTVAENVDQYFLLTFLACTVHRVSERIDVYLHGANFHGTTVQ